jgi:hypothetical protein
MMISLIMSMCIYKEPLKYSHMKRAEDFGVYLGIAILARKTVELERHVMFPIVYYPIESTMLFWW